MHKLQKYPYLWSVGAAGTRSFLGVLPRRPRLVWTKGRASSFLALVFLLKTSAASAWSVNAFLLYVSGLPDPYTAAEVGCSHPDVPTRITSVQLISVEPATATVICESYDATTAEWWYWKEPFIAAEPGDQGFFMDANGYHQEGQGKSCPASENPINLINGNKYKVYTDIASKDQSGMVRPGFTRFYNSQSTRKQSPIGSNWTHSYDRRMHRQDFLRTKNNLDYSSGGSGSDAFQSGLYSSRQAACESGIAEVRAQSAGLGPGPYHKLQAFLGAEARWIDDECRIYVDGRYRATFPINSHGIRKSGDSIWDRFLQFYRSDGNVVTFRKVYSGIYPNLEVSWEDETRTGHRMEQIDVTPAPEAGGVVENESLYVLIDPQNIRETYDRFGKLLFVDHPNGLRESLIYQDERVTRIETDLGQFITIRYGADGYIESVSDEAARSWQYRYKAGNLVEVVNPDLTSVKYHYEDSNFPAALTGETDQRGMRFSTFEYYADGLARSSYLGPPGRLTGSRVSDTSVTYESLLNSVTDSRGFQSTYYFSSDVTKGLLTRFDGPECVGCVSGSRSFDYDLETFSLLGKTDYGLKTIFENHDRNGNPGIVREAVATPLERVKLFSYDPRFFAGVSMYTGPSVYPAGTKVSRYTYDDAGNATAIRIEGHKPDGAIVRRSRTFEYNSPLHQLTRIDGARTDVDDSYVISYYPDSAFEGSNRARIRSITAPLGIVLYGDIRYTPTGKLAGFTTGAGLQADFTYYPGNDRLETQTLVDIYTGKSRATLWTYLPTGEVKSVTRGYATPDATEVTFEYDDARRLTRVYDGMNNYMEYLLDTEGNVVSENIYDNAGFLRKSLERSFDAYNRLESLARVNERYTWSNTADGALATGANGNGVITDYGYDALRRLTSVTRDDGGSDPTTANALIRFDYDVQDNLTAVIDPDGGKTRYVYDDLGNLILLDSPDTGVSTYAHDEAGNVTHITDARGQSFSYSYDAMGRILFIDAPGTLDDVRFGYDQCESGTGRLCTVTRGNTTTSYSYTAFGDIRSTIQVVKTVPSYEQATTRVDYSYDAAGRLKDMVYPGGTKVTYTYDAAGNVYSVILNDGETNLVIGSQYYPFGPDQRVIRGNGSIIYGLLDQAYRTWINGHGGYFYDVIYYDNNGNPATFYSSEGGRQHTYDALDRLSGSTGPYGVMGYEYDLNGNRTSKTARGISHTYHYSPASNRMSTGSGAAVMLDANGNTLTLHGDSASYTTDNRLLSISGTAKYAYNGVGERVMKAVPPPGNAGSYGFELRTVYVYGLDGKLLAEVGSTGQVKQEYIYMNGELLATIVYNPGGDEPILNADMDEDGAVGVDDFLTWYFNHYNSADITREVNADGQMGIDDLRLVLDCALSGAASPGCTTTAYSRSIYYSHNDHLGTPHMLSDEKGVAVWSGVYDPFGAAVVNEDLDADGVNVTLNIRFPGQYYDSESGLHYNYYRYYDPSTGRYITSDPIGLSGGLNTYGYVYQNPIKFVDPTGEIGLAGSVAGGVIGGVSSIAGSLATGGSLADTSTWINAGIAITVGVASGFVGDYTGGARTAAIRAAALGLVSNTASQMANLRMDGDPCNDNDFNYGSMAGSALGGLWAGHITRIATPTVVDQVSAGMIGWQINTASSAVGTELGR